MPRSDDIYLVVDEQDAGTAVVLASRWPEIDALGRLCFPARTPLAVTTPQDEIEAAVARSRAPRAAKRPLRIGDVSLVRGLPAEGDRQLAKALKQPPSEWGQFVDVTGSARDAAKAALFAAAAPRA